MSPAATSSDSSAAAAARPGRGRDLVLGVSGASGMLYARAFALAVLERTAYRLHVVFTPAAGQVMQDELGVALRGGVANPFDFLGLDGAAPEHAAMAERMVQHPPRDIGARLASGSFLHDGMAIVPASMNTVGSLASGVTPNLLTRAADVTLKEGRRLVIVPRETPLSLIHLRALTTLAEAGARILPAMPAFYHKPKTIDDLARFLAMKIFDQFQIPFESADRWTGLREPAGD
jgi:4-hydroxy-3-polyprenylbenzoate decarboxylase